MCCDQGDDCIHCSNERQEVVMGTGITALEQLINCVLDCRDMRDLRRRRKEAVQIFIQRRSAGSRCLGPFANDPSDRSFPIYAPLLFMSLDRLICGDFGLVLAFFRQMPEAPGKQVGMNSYSYSIYLTLPIAAYLWALSVGGVGGHAKHAPRG